MGGHEEFSDDSSQRLVKLSDTIHKLLPAILVLLLAYLYITFFTSYSSPIISYIEKFILLFFVSELLVDGILYESNKQFIKDKWINIILILPFFAAFRAAGRIGQLLQASRSVEILQFAWIAELPTVTRAAEAIRTSRLSAYISYAQKGFHAIVDGKKVLLKKLK